VLSLHCSGSITSFVAAPALGRHNFQFSGSGSDNRNGKEALFDRCIIRGEQRDATPSATGLRAAPRSYLQSHRRANREPPVKLRSVNSIPSEVRGPFHRPSTSPGSPSVFHYRSLPIGEPDCMIQGANIAHSYTQTRGKTRWQICQCGGCVETCRRGCFESKEPASTSVCASSGSVA
jgi:hypothetical protein